MADTGNLPPLDRKTKVLHGDSGRHLAQLRAEDSELDKKAEAWAAYFQKRGIPRSPAHILETWGRLEEAVPPWPPE
ncbi:hypothetical protein HY251_09300 [bacterium]|nr:hypothetical protein [bacterium]